MTPRTRRAAWPQVLGILLLVLCQASLQSSDYGAGGEASPVQAAIKLAFYAFLGFVALLLVLARPSLFAFRPEEWVLLCVLALGTLGTLLVLPRQVGLLTGLSLLAVALFCVLASRQSSTPPMTWAYRGLFLVVAVSALLAFAGPEAWLVSGGRPRLRGFIGHPNGLGMAAALFLVLHAARFLSRTRRSLAGFLLPAALAAVVLWLTNSRTSMLVAPLALLAGLALVQVRVKQADAVVPWALGALAAVGLVLAGFLLASSRVATLGTELGEQTARSGSLDEITSLTGRTDVWKVSLHASERQPLFGYGWRAGEEVLPTGWREEVRPDGWVPLHSHSLYFETLLSTGVVGALLAFVLVAALFLRILGRGLGRGKPWGRPLAQASVLVFLLLVGLTERSFAGTVNLAFVMLCLLVADLRWAPPPGPPAAAGAAGAPG
jgi:O-antigen ligase